MARATALATAAFARPRGRGSTTTTVRGCQCRCRTGAREFCRRKRTRAARGPGRRRRRRRRRRRFHHVVLWQPGGFHASTVLGPESCGARCNRALITARFPFPFPLPFRFHSPVMATVMVGAKIWDRDHPRGRCGGGSDRRVGAASRGA